MILCAHYCEQRSRNNLDPVGTGILTSNWKQIKSLLFKPTFMMSSEGNLSGPKLDLSIPKSEVLHQEPTIDRDLP